MTTLTQLAEKALEHAKKLDAYSESNGLPPCHFFYDTLTDLPALVQEERDALVDASDDLRRLALGPTEMLFQTMSEHTGLLSLRFIYKHNIAALVPPVDQISFHQLSEKTGVNEDILKRILKHAMCRRFFAEATPGYVRHTATSRLLLEQDALDFVGFQLEELAPSSLKFEEALEKWPDSKGLEPTQTAFNFEKSTSKTYYQELVDHPERARRFGSGMKIATRGLWDLKHIIQGYEWAALDRANATIVDVGGGHGRVSVALANKFPNIKLTVQDLPGTAEEGQKQLAPHLQGRVEFMPHDFFTPQPCKADAYILGFILHNWPDLHALKILAGLIPALRNGNKILICELQVPDEQASTRWSHRQTRDLDMVSLLAFGSLERTEAGWKALFAEADKRLKLVKIHNPPGSRFSLIEAVWEEGYQMNGDKPLVASPRL